MKQTTKMNLIIFLIIALIAFALSNVFAGVASIDNSNSTKLTAIENDSFEAHEIDDVEVIIPKVENITNNTNQWENWTDDVVTVANDTWNGLIG